MFTGIIETVGSVEAIRPGPGGKLMTVDLGKIAAGTGLGDSISINGVCLTISKLAGNRADFDISSETLARSTLGRISAGRKVNLERAMAADGRFGGHIVQGHVDGIAKMSRIDRKGEFASILFGADGQLLEEMVTKGSVAIDGISLTVSDLNKSGFSVALIPTTLQETTLAKLQVGDEVNIETDIVVKVIKSQLDKMIGDGKGMTADKLRGMGF